MQSKKTTHFNPTGVILQQYKNKLKTLTQKTQFSEDDYKEIITTYDTLIKLYPYNWTYKDKKNEFIASYENVINYIKTSGASEKRMLALYKTGQSFHIPSDPKYDEYNVQINNLHTRMRAREQLATIESNDDLFSKLEKIKQLTDIRTTIRATFAPDSKEFAQETNELEKLSSQRTLELDKDCVKRVISNPQQASHADLQKAFDALEKFKQHGQRQLKALQETK